jgi:hypothetical protein
MQYVNPLTHNISRVVLKHSAVDQVLFEGIGLMKIVKKIKALF